MTWVTPQNLESLLGLEHMFTPYQVDSAQHLALVGLVVVALMAGISWAAMVRAVRLRGVAAAVVVVGIMAAAVVPKPHSLREAAAVVGLVIYPAHLIGSGCSGLHVWALRFHTAVDTTGR